MRPSVCITFMSAFLGRFWLVWSALWSLSISTYVIRFSLLIGGHLVSRCIQEFQSPFTEVTFNVRVLFCYHVWMQSKTFSLRFGTRIYICLYYHNYKKINFLIKPNELITLKSFFDNKNGGYCFSICLILLYEFLILYHCNKV